MWEKPRNPNPKKGKTRLASVGDLDLETQWLSSWACQKKKKKKKSLQIQNAIVKQYTVQDSSSQPSSVLSKSLWDYFAHILCLRKTKKAIKRTMRKKLEYFKCGWIKTKGQELSGDIQYYVATMHLCHGLWRSRNVLSCLWPWATNFLPICSACLPPQIIHESVSHRSTPSLHPSEKMI